MPRFDLTPDPSAPGAATLESDGTIVGPFGGALALLFSERFRFISGHDCRKLGQAFEPHPLGRAFVSGRKCIPWMHHPHVPHAILERRRDAGDPGSEGDECDWLMVMGTFGPSHDWGDGSEANYPQYGIRKTAKDRRGELWEDGVALELSIVGEDGRERRLSDLHWQIRHRPGLVELVAVDEGAVERVQLAAPAGERCGKVRVKWRRGAIVPALIARARFLARRLTVAPLEHQGAIDVLNAPFGFQKFEELALAPRALRNGIAFDVASLGARLFFVANQSAELAGCAVADPRERTHGGFLPAAEGLAAPCFDVVLRVAPGSDGAATEIVFGVEDGRDAARSVESALAVPMGATARDLEGEEGRDALRLESGDRWLDGLLRWSRNVAHALVAPNGVVMTGAIGYSAKSHVGQDVPFVLPLFLLDPHPRLRNAARRMLEYVVASPSARDERLRGILDHPCEGRDFAFLPMRPRSARVFRPIGAAGLFRWILVLERFLASGGDRDVAQRAFELFANRVERHYLPFSLANECWSGGEETQELPYSLTAGFEGLGALLRIAHALAPERAARAGEAIESARSVIRKELEKPVSEGGLRLAEPFTRAGVTLDAGFIVRRAALEKDPPWFGFDLPLVGAHALVHGALSRVHSERLAELLSDPRGTFRVRGAGLAKSPGGEKGVWFWHNALVAKGLVRHGSIDLAFELFGLMARGIADMNGLGVPGEETNGGDYAMGIGALAGLALVESLLGLSARGDRLTLQPALPSSLDHVVVHNLTIGARRFRIEITRRRPGPLQAANPSTLDPTGDSTLRFDLG